MFGDYRNEATLLDQQRPSLFVVASRSAANALPYIRKNWPASEVLSFGGHLMFWEHHDRFNDALRQFVARTKADTKPAAQEHRSRRVV
jgi:pimeloyl-ACP methyl ester carboxylesterase